MLRSPGCFGQHVTETISYLQRLHDAETDPVRAMRLTGFLVLTVVSAIEVDVRDGCTEVGARFHSTFAGYVAGSLEKTNARVKTNELSGLIGRFGEPSRKAFDERIATIKRRCMRWARTSLHPQYENLLTCRNSFAHTGAVTMTFAEAMRAARHAGFIVVAFRRELHLIRP
jgi:hypothetical protein